MNTLVIDRSTEHTSVVLVTPDGAMSDVPLGIWPTKDEGKIYDLRLTDLRLNCDNEPLGQFNRKSVNRKIVNDNSSFFILHSRDEARIARIVVGVGPGSFAGIRASLAFAKGYALGSGCEVSGLTSAAAFAEPDAPVAVVGDARRGQFWIALFEGYRLVTDVFQVTQGALPQRVPRGVKVVSPDARRIGSTLTDLFGDAYTPAPPLDARRLARAAAANPSLLTPDPLPLYLNPAVRD